MKQTIPIEINDMIQYCNEITAEINNLQNQIQKLSSDRKEHIENFLQTMKTDYVGKYIKINDKYGFPTAAIIMNCDYNSKKEFVINAQSQYLNQNNKVVKEHHTIPMDQIQFISEDQYFRILGQNLSLT